MDVTSVQPKIEPIRFEKEDTHSLSQGKPLNPITKWPAPTNSVIKGAFHLIKFDIFQPLTHDDLLYLIETKITEKFTELKSDSSTSLSSLRFFLLLVRNYYRDVPYHSFLHAFSVFQATVFLLEGKLNLFNRLSKEDLISMYIAALCHDLDHPGYTNGYLRIKNAKISELEDYHCQLFDKIISHKPSNILSIFDETKQEYIKKLVKKLIMATKMVNHGQYIDKIKLKEYQIKFDIANLYYPSIFYKMNLDGDNIPPEDPLLLYLSGILKCADISGEIRPSILSKTSIISTSGETAEKEFEGERGSKYTPKQLLESQLIFIHMCIPLYETMSIIDTAIRDCVTALHERREQYEKLLSKAK